MKVSDALNITGLVLTTSSAVLMWYFPPRGAAIFNDDGSQVVAWKNSPTEAGKAKARRQRWLSRSAPVALGCGFLLQLVAAIMAV